VSTPLKRVWRSIPLSAINTENKNDVTTHHAKIKGKPSSDLHHVHFPNLVLFHFPYTKIHQDKFAPSFSQQTNLLRRMPSSEM
jgi:hypothetical protein